MNPKVFRWVLGAIIILLVLGTGLVGGVILDRQVLTAFVPLSDIPPKATSDFQLIAQAWNTIQKFYVDRAEVKPLTMTYGAIGGMVDALGDTGHSRFLSPEMLKMETEFVRAKFQGIGAELQMKKGHVVIVAPLDGSPAQKADLLPGDIILRVNEENIMGLPLDQVVAKIAGPAGTSVTLTILDPKTGRTRTVTLKRAVFSLRSVTWRRLPGTFLADLRISGFSEGTTKELRQALIAIKSEKAKGIVLDLRNNPGGLLIDAVSTASQFLTKGNVLLEKNAQGKIAQVPVQPKGLAPHIPMVVLVNGGTASAAEIVSGALQDAHRAVLVGETTFGTGTVLKEFPLSGGSALLLAVEEWLTPDGHTIWHKGITPNIVVSLPSQAIPIFPDALGGMTPAQLQASGDTQLLRAMNLLAKEER